MRKAYVGLMIMALVLTGCKAASPVSPPAAVTAPPVAWPNGWPTSIFPTPIPGETVVRTLQMGGGGLGIDAVVLSSPDALSDAQARYGVAAPKMGLLPQQNFDSVMAEVNGMFSTSGLTIASVWARQDQDKMYAVACATESGRPVVVYVKRQTSWTPLSMPADWPVDLVLPLDAQLQALLVDLQTNTTRAILYAKTPKTEAIKRLSTELSRSGFTQVSGRAAWTKDGVTVGVTKGSDYDTVLIVEYTVRKQAVEGPGGWEGLSSQLNIAVVKGTSARRPLRFIGHWQQWRVTPGRPIDGMAHTLDQDSRSWTA